MPLWVKVGIVVGLILLVVAIIAFAVGGNHGPGRHSSSPYTIWDASAPL
jgi:hypothetical protein